MWDITQHRVVVCYRHFGTAYRPHLQVSSLTQSTLRKILEERRSDLHRGRNLKLLTPTLVSRGNNTQINKNQRFLIRSASVH
jgi:hypothetical protein